METDVAFLEPRYCSSHRPGACHINEAWAYVPPVRPGFRLNLDREETTSPPSVGVLEADQRRREEFPIQEEQRYPSKMIESALREQIAQRNRLSVDQVVLGNGLMSLMTYIYSIFAQQGDRVVVPTPGFWPAYTYALQRGIGISMPKFRMMGDQATANAFIFPFDETKASLSGSRICYVCNPNNPTGTYVEPQAVRELVESSPDVLFVIDNAYGSFCARILSHEQGGEPSYHLDDSFGLIREGFENVLVGETFSKAYGLANHRVAYFCGHRNLVATLSAHMGPYDLSEINLSLAYYNYIDSAYVTRIVDAVVSNKVKFEEQLESCGISHFGGYRNSILVRGLDLAEAYEAQGIAVRSMVYQDGIPNAISDTFRITVPSDDRSFGVLEEVTATIARQSSEGSLKTQ